MKKCYLDANFLVYLKSENSPQFLIASTKLTKLVKNKTELCVSPLTIDEFMHAMLFLAKINKERVDLRKDLGELLELPKLTLINPPLDRNSQFLALDFMQKYHIGPRDSYHLLTMLSNSVDTFATFDTDFNKVFASKVITLL